METRKIAVACFIGGMLCCAVAFMFAPAYWWFGLLAGFAGGYISYEFREVLRTIPVAWRSARNEGVRVWKGLIDHVREYLSKSHPFIYTASVIAVPLSAWSMSYFFLLMKPDALIVGVSFAFLLVITGIVIFIEIAYVIASFIVFFAFIGARKGERAYWWPPVSPAPSHDRDCVSPEKLEAKGLRRMPLTYINVWRWIAKGIGLTVLFFVWTLWKYLAIGIWEALCFFGRFAWHLFELIHSQKRMLCAIDGTLGGAVSYIWFISASMSFGSQLVLVVFGGLLGAAFGVANWEIVSKRLLHVHVQES